MVCFFSILYSWFWHKNKSRKTKCYLLFCITLINKFWNKGSFIISDLGFSIKYQMNEWCTDTSSFVSNSTPGLTFDSVPLNDLASDRELVCGSYDKFNTGSHLWTWSFPFLSTSQVSCWSNDNLYNPSSRNKQTWRYEGSQEVGNRKLLIGQQVTREKRGILLGNEPKTSLWWSCTQHDSIDILFGKSFSFLSRTWNQRAHRHYHFSTEADNILCFYTNYVLLFFFFLFFFF